MEKKTAAAAAYREDCWSEGATATLIEAWGDRYLELNRGNLRQKQWQEVADAVNLRQTAVKRPHRTDVQCKNRIDTLKKKYKLEKARVTDSDGAVRSNWPFYWRLDMLIGPSVAAGSTVKKRSTSRSLSASLSPPLPLPYRKTVVDRKRKLPAMEHAFLKKGSYSVAAAAAAAAKEDVDSESEKSSSGEFGAIGWRSRLPANGNSRGGDNGVDGMKELAEAIARFGEIYEKVESAKQRQMMELEKQRMEFSKGIEFQRMQMFVDSQVQLAKIKRARGGTAAAASGASDS